MPGTAAFTTRQRAGRIIDHVLAWAEKPAFLSRWARVSDSILGTLPMTMTISA